MRQWMARAVPQRAALLMLLTAWALLTAAAAAVLPAAARLDFGTTRVEPFAEGFFAPEANDRLTYAFSSADARLQLPGFGAAPTRLTLRVSGDRVPGMQPPPLTVSLAGLGDVTLQLRPGVARYHLLAPSAPADLTLQFSSPTFVPSVTDTRQLGVAFDWIDLQQLGWGRAWPTAVAQLAIAAAASALLHQLAVERRLAVIAVVLLLSASTALLLAEPLLWAAQLPRTAWLLVVLAALLPLLRRGFSALAQRGGVTFSPRAELMLWRIVTAAAVIKISGVISPQIIVYDERWHVPRTIRLLEGRALELILPGRETLLGSTVGLEGGHFPYSPLWYFLVAPFGLLGADLGITSNVLNVSLDVSRSLLLAFIAMRLSGRERTAVAAALVYQLLPLPYWLISWGNWPTQLGLWGALVLIAVYSAVDPTQLSRRQLLLLSAAAALAMATYTVVGVMALLLIGAAALFAVLLRQRSLLTFRQTLLALVAGEALIFAIYHVWFVPTLLGETVPVLWENLLLRFGGVLPAAAAAAAAVERAPLPNAAIDGAFLLNHLSWIGIGLIAAGLPLLWRQVRASRPLIAAWLSITVLFTAVSWTAVDMILKQYFFLLPLAALSGGSALETLSRHRRFGRLAALGIVLALAAFCAWRWYELIMFKRHILAN
jgi:hypothetical protein